jgi:hypothetical protein
VTGERTGWRKIRCTCESLSLQDTAPWLGCRTCKYCLLAYLGSTILCRPTLPRNCAQNCPTFWDFGVDGQTACQCIRQRMMSVANNMNCIAWMRVNSGRIFNNDAAMRQQVRLTSLLGARTWQRTELPVIAIPNPARNTGLSEMICVIGNQCVFEMVTDENKGKQLDNSVACIVVPRQRPRNKQLYNGRY